jgi:hypothetical protein
MSNVTIERAGIEFEFSFYDDSDERGPHTGFALESTKLVDPVEFTACTDLPATPENVAEFINKNDGIVGEEALEKLVRDDWDGPEPDDDVDYDGC